MIGTVLLTALAAAPCDAGPAWTLVAHGGAGSWQGTPERHRHLKAILREVLEDGARRLERGEGAVEVIEAAVMRLEDAPELNAGRGGIPNGEGVVELDAAIMRGSDRAAGAVAAVRTVKNPIRLARRVMERSRHVLLVGRGAEAWAKAQGLRPVEPGYFLVAPRRRKSSGSKSGTVGVVALDRCGEIAAGTSTGGYDEKTPGRVGDVPVIGAGTYADRATAALSATGWGEWFIRFGAAHEVAARMAHAGASLEAAMTSVLADIEAPGGAKGGLIGVTAKGAWAAVYTSPGMLRGVATHAAPEPRVGIFDALE